MRDFYRIPGKAQSHTPVSSQEYQNAVHNNRDMFLWGQIQLSYIIEYRKNKIIISEYLKHNN